MELYGAKFKLIGATYEEKGQDILSQLCGLKDRAEFFSTFAQKTEKPQLQDPSYFATSIAYKVVLEEEPSNPVDKEAIMVKLCLEKGKFIKIGYVVKELTKDVHPFLADTTSFLTSVRYRSAFKREGYYGILNLVKTGPWSKRVMASGRGVS